MIAADILEHFQRLGTWVDWEKTVDVFLHGDPKAKVRGVAVAWIATNAALETAAAKGLNLFISHEPCFYGSEEVRPAAAAHVREKRAILDRHGLTLLRCHDTWDRMPGVGIPDAWGDFLRFECDPRPVDSFFKMCRMDETTVEELARRLLAKLRPLGQECILVYGDRNKRVRSMAIGTGALSNAVLMAGMDPDCVLTVDDRLYTPGISHWAVDSGMPMLIVSHAVSEFPGMMAMARHLGDTFPGVPVEYIPVAFPYRAIFQ